MNDGLMEYSLTLYQLLMLHSVNLEIKEASNGSR